MSTSAGELGELGRRAPVTDALKLFRHLAGWPLRVHRARRLMHQLAGLEDHELRDIGLSRLDIQATQALPLDADPSWLLRRRAEDRRR